MRTITAYYTVQDEQLYMNSVVQSGSTKSIETTKCDYLPYFYSKRDISDIRIVKSEVVNALNGTFTKYYTKLPVHVKELRQEDKDGNCTDFEADVLFGQRYIYDNNIKLGDEKLSKCYIDIETEMNKTHFPRPDTDAITFISLYANGLRTVITCAHQYKPPEGYIKEMDLYIVDTEKDMLELFFKIAQPYSMLIGWNSRAFDQPFIFERSKRYGLQMECRNFIWADMLDLYRRFISSYTTGKTPPSSLSLDNVAKYVLGYGKIGNAVQILQSTDLLEVARYNLNDSELVYKIDEQTKLTDLVDNFSLVLNLLPVDCDYFGKMIEYCIMREMRGRYIFKCRTKPALQRVKGIKGAYVFDPPTGIFKNVAVFDFAGLYPNIIRSLNASPETVVDDNSTLPNLITAPETGNKFKSEPEGVFSKFITNLMELRKEYKRLKAETHDDKYEPLQQLTKYLINAFYGSTAHSNGRIYDKRIGESVTGTGRFLIHEIEKHFTVIYGDTDSVMLPLNDTSIDYIKSVEERMNMVVKQSLTQYNIKGNYMNIRFEKMFDKVFFYGVKKRYFGTVTIDEDYKQCNKVVSRGLEVRRTDWCKAAVEYEAGVLSLMLTSIPKAKAFHQNYLAHLRELPLDKFVIYKTLTKPITEYKNKPPHVRAATDIDWIGTKIGYVVSGWANNKILAIRYADESNINVSYRYYSERQIGRLYQRLLEPLIGVQTKLSA